MEKKSCLLALALVPVIVLAPLWAGFVMSWLWNWHIAGWDGLPQSGTRR